MSNVIQKLNGQGQSIWCDNLSRAMLDRGELSRLIGLGVVGITSNPTIFMNAIAGSEDYDARIAALAATGLSSAEIYENLVLPDIVEAADLLRPVYDRTHGVDGFVSLEVNPHLAYDTAGTVSEARRLFGLVNRPNVFIKVPGTPEGVPAIETLIGEGIHVNVTLIFARGLYEKVMLAYLNGLKRIVAAGGNPDKVASVASFFVSRVDTLVDKLLVEKHPPHADISDLLGKAAVANARLAYARFEVVFRPGGAFDALRAEGARVQRPLWASTSTKNPDYPATKYVDELVAPQSVNTLPLATIDAVLHEGRSAVSIHDDLPGARAIFEQLARLGIHLDAVTEKLLADGVAAFAKSYDELLAGIEQKRRRLRAAG